MALDQYPAMRWHPESGVPIRVTKAAEDDPSYLSYHPKDPRAQIKAKVDELHRMTAAESTAFEAETAKAPTDLSDDEVKQALQGGNVAFPPDATPAALRALLVSSLTAALAKKGVVPPAGANAKLLLEILRN